MAVLLFLALAGCATSEEVRRSDGSREYVVSCTYFNWAICYEKARELCRGPYKMLAESEGLNRKELRIACLETK